MNTRHCLALHASAFVERFSWENGIRIQDSLRSATQPGASGYGLVYKNQWQQLFHLYGAIKILGMMQKAQ
ncbi:hypothetical protein TCAP_06334 [Tolypocladium capitatum]|uniref:Uncharacterized protein n=1 Tax=Tolypocladium capitatum TaxID=45235 RepID=A0A2K3Q832_9HYPO|nr:hypothetical protein TCAP_06334 [Tolypocladium capitatum]